MLIGEYHYTIDPKGRINFPTKLREVLGESFVVAKDLRDSCLTVYSVEGWRKLEEQLHTLPMAQARVALRKVSSSAFHAVPDKQGRILIPASLKEYAMLEKEVMVVGVSNHCEIWDAATWQKDVVENEEADAVLSEVMNALHF